MQLHTVRAAGFTATVDAFAQDGDQLWFLSLLGSQQAVRALWARLVIGWRRRAQQPCQMPLWEAYAHNIPTSRSARDSSGVGGSDAHSSRGTED